MGYREFPSYKSDAYGLSLVKCGFLRRMFIRKEIKLYQFKPTYELGIYPRVGTKTKTMSPWIMLHYANKDIALVRMKFIAQLLNKYGIWSVMSIIGETMLGRGKSFGQRIEESIRQKMGTENNREVQWNPPYDPKLESVFVLLPHSTEAFKAQYGTGATDFLKTGQ